MLSWRHILDRTVLVFEVVPVNKLLHPATCVQEVFEGFKGLLRAVL